LALSAGTARVLTGGLPKIKEERMMPSFKSGLLRMQQLFGALEKYVRWVFILYVFLAVFITVEVFFRYFLRSPHDWFLEVAILGSVYCGFLGAGAVTFEKRHIAIDLFTRLLSPRVNYWLDILNNVGGIVASVMLAYYCWQHVSFLREIDARHESSLGMPYLLEPLGASIGLVLCLVYFLSNLIALMTSGESPKSEGGH